MQKLSIAFVLIFAFTWSNASLAQINSLDSLITEFLEKNKSILAKDEAIKASLSKQDSASFFLPPVFGADYANMPTNAPYLGNHPMSSIGLSLSQTFLAPGTGSFRKNSYEQFTQSKRFDRSHVQNQEVANLLVMLAHHSFFEELSKISGEHIKNLKRMRNVIDARYKVNQSSQLDLLRLKTLLLELENKKSVQEKNQESLKFKINALLYRKNLNQELPNGLTLSETAELSFDVHENVSKKISGTPNIQSLKAKSKAFEASAKLAKREAWPKITVQASYRFRKEIVGKDQGQDFIGLGVKIPLSFFGMGSRNLSKRDENLLNARASELMAEHLINSQSAHFIFEAKNFQENLASHKNYVEKILPLTKQSLKAASNAYELNQTTFSSLFDAQKEALEIQNNALQSKLLARTSQINLEKLLGVFADFRSSK